MFGLDVWSWHSSTVGVRWGNIFRFILPVELNQFDPQCLQVEQAFDVSHFSWRRMLTLPLAVRLQMCLTAGDELCFQRGDDGRKVEVVACVASAFSFDFLSSFAFCSLCFHFLLPTRPYLYVHTHMFAALVFIFCSLLGLTYMFIHTGLLLCCQNAVSCLLYVCTPVCCWNRII